MKKENRSMDKGSTQGLRLLVCDPAGTIDESSVSDEAWALSPIQCLDKAMNLNPQFIVVRFGDVPIREREALVELCAALKRNRHTQDSHLVALLHSMHRTLLEDLNKAGVDYIHVVGKTKLNSSHIRKIIKALGPDDRMKRYLEIMCPFLHYNRIDSRYGITLCGAYLDRLVLGGRRLHELCETADHLGCGYYIKPRCTP
jgi:hypothetical protein